MPRILLAGLFHETNTFTPGTMGLDQFSVTLAPEDWAARRGDGSPTGAFLDEAARRGWEVVPVVDIRGTPGGMPEAAVFERFLNEFEARTATREQVGALDAIFLVLHGAMVSPGIADPEGALLARIRANPLLAELPIFGVLDLHANITEAMARHSNALLAYQKNPHTDAAETAVRAFELMERVLAQRLTLATRYVPSDLLWPPTGTGTADEPMRSLEALARSQERDGVEEVNVFAGFSHADVPHAGVAFSIVYDTARVTPQQLDTLGHKLVAHAEAHREAGLPQEWELSQAIADAEAKGLFPTLLVEPADNIGGGATGDGTQILRALLEAGASGSGVVICDPESVAALADLPLGEEAALAIGGKRFPQHTPVAVRAKLLHRSDGRYTLEDRHSHAASMNGVSMQMGPCAVVEAQGVTILLTSRRSAPMDLGQWRSQGVDPATLRFIGVKAAVAHRQAYDPIAKASYWVRTLGPCTSELRSLPYQHVRRPVFPLDAER